MILQNSFGESFMIEPAATDTTFDERQYDLVEITSRFKEERLLEGFRLIDDDPMDLDVYF